MSDGHHAFFNMFKYPQIGDHIQDLSLSSKPFGVITDLKVLSNGHAVACVRYFGSSIAPASFNFVNHGLTWRLLLPDEHEENEIGSF